MFSLFFRRRRAFLALIAEAKLDHVLVNKHLAFDALGVLLDEPVVFFIRADVLLSVIKLLLCRFVEDNLDRELAASSTKDLLKGLFSLGV